jgi:hypothetical protein
MKPVSPNFLYWIRSEVAAGLPSSPCGLRRGEKQLVRRRLGEGDRACWIGRNSGTAGKGRLSLLGTGG